MTYYFELRPFIVNPRVIKEFDFRCLKENRRVVQDQSRREELDRFHGVLNDIAHGFGSNDVRQFIIDAYVRGAKLSADNVEFEGATAVFTKRLGPPPPLSFLSTPASPQLAISVRGAIGTSSTGRS